MKLSQPFIRLPRQFDVARLQAEVAQFAEHEWQRHPNGFPGNSALRLISVDGGQTDSCAGRMLPTAQLQRCPYIRQVLSSFGVVWSRSRLMRLAPGASVPEHSDTNYHWFNRVRVHIPVTTEPEVAFHCDGQTVHMAAGDAWIFDNWRRHSVYNGGTRDRVHLVADTAGNAAFWRLAGGAAPAFVRFHPQGEALLHCERYNVAAVMPPAEVEHLSFDLLADLRRPQSSEERAAYAQFGSLVTSFCREWRALWSVYADTPDGWPNFQRLHALALDELERVPTGLTCASNGADAVEVFRLRVLLYAFYADGAAAVAEPDRTLAAASPPPAAARAPARSATGPALERPVFIIAAPRSGSTLVFETLAQAPGLFSLGGEMHGVVERLPQLHPAAAGSNRLTAAHADAAVRSHILAELGARLRDRDGRPLEGNGRFLEKTPKNALRVPFFDALFPDALFVFLWRDPRENLSSIIEAWRSGGWITYPDLPGWDGPWSMLLPPDWQALRGQPLEQVAAYQWSSANRIALDDLERLPPARWTSLGYAEFLADPAGAVRRICDFAGLPADDRLAAYLARPLPLSQHTLTPPDPDKWRANQAAVERVLQQVEPVAARLRRLAAAAGAP
ncbi:MAG: sulfotransferase [Nevskia sp.]|nr:sulfotransferase [Nevskia sp.]